MRHENKRRLTDNAGAQLRHFAFGSIGERSVKMLSHDELENGIAQKLKPLIIPHRDILLIRIRRMCQRIDEQLLVKERVA
jgi:hypothetical protein